MVSIRDFFVAMGLGAERRLDELGNAGLQLLDCRGKYEQIEAHLEEMAADGRLSPGEAEQLLLEIRGAGLDTGALAGLAASLRDQDGAVGEDASKRLERAISKQLGDARNRVQDQLSDASAAMYREEHLVSTGFESAGAYNKKEHDTAMAIIKNMG